METNRISSRRTLAWRTSALPSRLLFFRSLLLSLPARARLQALFRERNEAREEVLLKYNEKRASFCTYCYYMPSNIARFRSMMENRVNEAVKELPVVNHLSR
jgi:hypothetical protein